MTDTYSNRLRLALQEPFSNTNTWGNNFNAGVTDLVEQALAGVSEVDVTSGNVTLTTANGSDDEARSMFLVVGGTPGVARNVIVPTLPKLYVVLNDSDAAITVKTSAGMGAIVPIGAYAMLFVDTVTNKVRSVGQYNAVAPATDWTDLVLSINNRTAGDSSVTCKWSRQGALVTFMMPAHSVTTSSGAWSFSGSIPAEIVPNSSFPFGSGCMVPAYVTGLSAGAAAALSIGATIAFANVGIASFGAGPFTLPRNLTFTYSPRRP